MSGETALSMERVGVQAISLAVGEIVLGPDFKGRKRKVGLNELYDHHRELEPVLGAEVERFALQDSIDRLAEFLGPEEGDKVCHLIQPIGVIHGP
jgi:hypothetical protein